MNIVHERQLLFAWLKRLNCPILVTEITKAMRLNQAFADTAPNFICVLKTYIFLPSSECKDKRSFSMLGWLKTYLRSTQDAAMLE